MSYTIRDYVAADSAGIAEIYNHHVVNTTVSFETVPVSAAEMASRLRDISATYPCLVCVDSDGRVVGYAYAHRWKEKEAYSATAETTVYVGEGHGGHGVGRMLMTALIERSREAGLHALIACITADNDASCRFHEGLGFSRVSMFREVGCKFGRWLDVADYELLL